MEEGTKATAPGATSFFIYILLFYTPALSDLATHTPLTPKPYAWQVYERRATFSINATGDAARCRLTVPPRLPKRLNMCFFPFFLLPK